MSIPVKILTWLADPWQLEFMRHAFAIGALLGVLCAIVGTYLIVQRMGLLGDVIAHAVLPGLAIAHFLHIDIFLGAFVFGTISSLVITWIQAQSRIKVDVAMAIVFSGFLGLGIALITILNSKLDLHQFLFGDILGVTTADLYRTLILTALTLIMVGLAYKELLFFTFDPLASQAMGLPSTWLHLGLIAIITLTIVTSMQVVGVVLVVSLLVAPAAAAYLLIKELHWMMVVGAILGMAASISGIYLSYYSNIPSGSAISLTCTSVFLLALLFSPSQGILTNPETSNRSVKLFRQFRRLQKSR